MSTEAPSQWDEQVDVLIAGSGAAGLVTAATVVDAGLSAKILERTDLVGGTSSVSGGGVWVPNNHHVSEAGVEDNRDEALRYMRLVSGGKAEERILEALVDRGPEMIHFLEGRIGFSFEAYPSVGPTLDYRFHLPGARHGGRTLDGGRFKLTDLGERSTQLRSGTTAGWVVRKKTYYEERLYLNGSIADLADRDDADPPEAGFVGGGAALVARLFKACLDLGVEIVTGTSVHSLIVEDGRVVGAWVDDADGRHSVRATCAVMLATGGYEWNEQLKQQFLNRPLTHPASPADLGRGDGLLLGLSVGAQVAGLGDAWWTPTVEVAPAGTGINGAPTTIMSRVERGLPHTLIVNRQGRRFANESLNYYDFPATFGQVADTAEGPANLPAFLILDQQFRSRYPLLQTKSDGIAAADPYWLTRADNLEELAAAIGVDAEGLVETVERFNGFASSGVDEDFHRGETPWDIEWGDPDHGPNPALGTIEQPPFYAVELHAGALGTKGGLRIDDRGRVMAAASDREVIDGLYAAGNVAAGSVPWGYTGAGATLGPACTFAYVAGCDIADKQGLTAVGHTSEERA
jgi:3-oxosteroid 1-dehydrogenase